MIIDPQYMLDGRTDGWMGGWVSGQVNGMDAQVCWWGMDGQTDKRMDGWMNRRMDGWMGVWVCG